MAKFSFAAISVELSGLSNVLDVAGPCQPAPVVERKILTIQERNRAQENNPLYVISRLMPLADDVRFFLPVTTKSTTESNVSRS